MDLMPKPVSLLESRVCLSWTVKVFSNNSVKTDLATRILNVWSETSLIPHGNCNDKTDGIY